jgi:uncharacterized protein (TIGR03435 family)
MTRNAVTVGKAVLWTMVSAAALCGAAAPVAQSPQPESLATSANTAPKAFEVATVRPANAGRTMSSTGVRLAPSGRLIVSNLVLVDLVRIAYMRYTSEGAVAGGPNWATQERFDITAKVDEAYMADWGKLTDNQRMDFVRPMLQQLLTERFHLQLHREMPLTPVYALVQVKSGTKMQEVAPPVRPEDATDSDPDAKQRKPPLGGFTIADGHWVGHAIQVPNVLWMIAARSGYTANPMIDATGLTGYYDFDIKLPDLNDAATFEKAVQDGLGLRIESRKVPYPKYVIDSAEKPSLDGADSQ